MKILPLTLILLFLLSLTSVSAAIISLNVQGTISGTCSPSSNIVITGYCPGQVGNSSCIVDNTTWVASGAGGYGSSLTYDNAIYATGLDVLVEATNASCSSTAYGNNTLTNAVGGGLPVTINVNMVNPFTLDTPANGSTVTNQTINFSWTNNIVSPSSTVQIDDDSNFGSVDESASGITDPNITIASSLLDGLYFWRVLTYIGPTLIQQSGVSNFTLANDAPTIINITPSNSTWLSVTSTTLSFNTDLPATCRYATSSGVAFASKTAFSTTGAYVHSRSVSLPSNGVNNFYVQCNGTNGKLMPSDQIIPVYRDTNNPDESSASISINGGATTTTNNTINVSWNGFVDATSSIAGYYVNTVNNEGTTGGTFVSGTSTLVSSLPDGVNTLYVWAVDDAGNIGDAVSGSITVDTQVPGFGSWSTSPTSIDIFTTSDVVVYVTISDTSALQSLPQLWYAIGLDANSTPANMTLVAGSVYSFTIPNQASPNDWTNRGGENLTVYVNATDSNGFNAVGFYTQLINDQFTAPVFNPVSGVAISQGTNTSIQLNSYDADGDLLTYTSNNSDITFVVINSSDSYAYWLPGNDDVGSNIVVFNVTDGYFNVSQAVVINVTNTNDAPVLGTIPDLQAYEYEEFNYTINYTDLDGDALSFSVNTSLFAITSTGNILFTPTASNRGSEFLQVIASDGNGGFDSANFTFDVLYCGDNICSSLYESSETCSLDCQDDQTSQGFIIDSKTCFGDTMTIRAVELVVRTQCPYKGTIINGWESCDNLTSTTFDVELDIQGEYVQIDTLVTDDFGLVAYTPNETGDYRLTYDSPDYEDIYFSVRECSLEEQIVSTESSRDDEEPEVNLPFFEEPLTDEQIVSLSRTTKLLYFVLLPFLFILIVLAGTTTYYRYDKSKGAGNFSHAIDEWLQKVQQNLQKQKEKYEKTKWYGQLAGFFSLVQKSLGNVSKSAVKELEPYIKQKELSVPFFKEKMGQFTDTQLLLQSTFEYYFKSKNKDNFTNALMREPLFQDKNSRIFALNAHKLGIPVQYHFSATKEKDELLLLHQYLPVHKSYPTLTDMKVELMKNNLVVLPLHMKTLNGAAPDKTFIAILHGFTKDGFYILDYSFSRKKKTFVPLGLLQQAWSKTGYVECLFIKK